MKTLEIMPWMTEETNETTEADKLHVPEYIQFIALAVLKQYDFSVRCMDVAATKPKKGGAIWKIETSEGPKSLKLLHRRPPRSIFSLGAQEYLCQQKARVPAIVKTNTGEKCVLAGGKIWFVAEWIESLTPPPKDLDGAKKLCYGLGEFHRLSKGYRPPSNAESASRVGNWEKKYRKILLKMDWFRHIAQAYHDLPASESMLRAVEYFEKQAQKALERLQNSKYRELARYGDLHWGLAHQDYGWSNGQLGKGGVWIIDLDGVAYDLPIRDLRKFISGMMIDAGHWDPETLRELIKAYHEANPLSKELYDLLLIDLSLPDEFYKNVKDVVYDPESFLNEETAEMLEEMIRTDASKWPALEEIANDWKDVKKKK